MTNYVVTETKIQGLLIIEPSIHYDERGFFSETFAQNNFNNMVGSNVNFLQENISQSKKGVLRGLHYQIRKPQGKLVRVTRGSIYDVAVDIRRTSKTFGQWFAIVLSGTNMKQLWIPEGFAHGFLSLEDDTQVTYKVTNYYDPASEAAFIWNDPSLGINWPIEISPLLSIRDSNAAFFRGFDGV